MLKKILIILTFAFCFKLSVISCYADGEFNTSYNVTYEITESGETRVTQDVTLTNNLDNVYATTYVIKTSLTRITGVESYDLRGQEEVGVTQNNNETTIKVNFNGQTVGVGNQIHFTLKYNTTDIAQKSGNIWEINIPKLGSGDWVDNYDVRLVIPKSFGNPTFITPKPIRDLIFNKAQLLKTGVTAIFGTYQLYDFNLKYQLKNDQKTSIITEIALPSDTTFQNVILSSIDPKPQSLKTDADGNWMAQYKLNPGELTNIRVTGQVKSFLSSQNKISLTSEERKLYTQPQKYWESNSRDIIERAQKLKTPKDIYDFVSNTLSYNYNKANSDDNTRLGAEQTLKTPDNAVCSEFTDLFIALSRAAGIPARELDGYANTQNSVLRPLSLEKDILHAWPEYYDDEKQTWEQVDPTWGNTTKGVDYFNKLDFNHVSFVTKGIDSEYPYPAGSYKFEDTNQKDVEVSVTDAEVKIAAKELDIKFLTPKNFTSGLENSGIIKITNPNPVGLSDILPNLVGDPIDIKSINISKFSLPPYATQEIKFSLKNTSFLENQKETLIFKIEDLKINKEIDISPLLPVKFWPVSLGVLILLIYARFIKKKVKKST